MTALGQWAIPFLTWQSDSCCGALDSCCGAGSKPKPIIIIGGKGGGKGRAGSSYRFWSRFSCWSTKSSLVLPDTWCSVAVASMVNVTEVSVRGGLSFSSTRVFFASSFSSLMPDLFRPLPLEDPSLSDWLSSSSGFWVSLSNLGRSCSLPLERRSERVSGSWKGLFGIIMCDPLIFSVPSDSEREGEWESCSSRPPGPGGWILLERAS